MPGVVTMENGAQNGVRSNHDRDQAVNGINGIGAESHQQSAIEKGKGIVSGVVANGGNDGSLQGQADATARSRMNDLPDEIQHITQGFIPLHLLITRLAQATHNALQEKIIQLAKMPAPAAAVNGNANHVGTLTEDASAESIEKKHSLLKFAQEAHTKWVKALVITDWSRKADIVSKLIDLKAHIDRQRFNYDLALDQLIEVKRGLTYARLPNPDLKTALQVLSTGDAPWMPEVISNLCWRY
jgi:mediator of RNA polymerase II transcription subunit 14